MLNTLFAIAPAIFKNLLVGLVLISVSTGAQEPSTKHAQLVILSPAYGSQHDDLVKVEVQVTGMMIMPAGVPHPDAGHIHLRINPSSALLAAGKTPSTGPLDLDMKRGERSASLRLPPGSYTLQAVLTDHKHRVHLPPVASELVEFTVRSEKKITKPQSTISQGKE